MKVEVRFCYFTLFKPIFFFLIWPLKLLIMGAVHWKARTDPLCPDQQPWGASGHQKQWRRNHNGLNPADGTLLSLPLDVLTLMFECNSLFNLLSYFCSFSFFILLLLTLPLLLFRLIFFFLLYFTVRAAAWHSMRWHEAPCLRHSPPALNV